MSLGSGDLDAYLRRIGFIGEPRADRSTLTALVAAHCAAIPFENLDPLLGRAVDLAPQALVDKLVHARRGGYCFEQNGLLRLVLERIGLEVTGLAARVLWMRAEDEITPRTHMALLVALDSGPVIADVGFGGTGCTGVLDLLDGVAQETPHERFWLLRDGDGWRQEVEISGEWRPTYRFDLTPQLAVDYELANWWTCANPQSHFTFSLVAARALPGRRLALRNFDYAVHTADGAAERRTLSGPEEACAVLETQFAIAVPERERLLERLRTLA